MVYRVVFWSCFGLAVRGWQLGIEMRPMFARKNLWSYPFFAAGGASFGYWLQGISDHQDKVLGERKEQLLAKRVRKAERDEREAAAAAAAAVAQ